jgi:hypothetical protein
VRARSARRARALCVSEPVRACVHTRACVCVCVCPRVGRGWALRPRPRPGQAGIFPPSRMGDAESCLFRQQTREVRKKPLINYRFLRAAASAELRALTIAALRRPCRAARTAGAASPEPEPEPEPEPRREPVRSAEPAGRTPSGRAAPGQRNRAQPSGRSAAATPGTRGTGRGAGVCSPLTAPALEPPPSPPSAPIPASFSPPRREDGGLLLIPLARVLLFPRRRGSGFWCCGRCVCVSQPLPHR